MLWPLSSIVLICSILFILLSRWLKNVRRKEATTYLEDIRKGRSNSLFIRSLLYDPLQEAGLSLRDIGTSENEIKAIQTRDALELLLLYREVLKSIRQRMVTNPKFSESFADAVKSFVERSLITYDDIDTSETEISLWKVLHEDQNLSFVR